MSATTLSENKYKHIESPALKVAIKTSVLAPNFPRDVLNGPVEYMGMYVNSLYQNKGTKHTIIPLNHGKA